MPYLLGHPGDPPTSLVIKGRRRNQFCDIKRNLPPTQKLNFQHSFKVGEILPHIVMIKIISMQALREMIIPGAGAQGAP